MSCYVLFDYESAEWSDVFAQLSAKSLESVDDVKSLISALGHLADDVEFKTLDICQLKYADDSRLLTIFNQIKQHACQVRELFPTGKIPRLNDKCAEVRFSRRQVLCLLCHMVLCSLKKTGRNFYWVTFENWLTDGRTCCIAYLQTLLEYFRQIFTDQNLENADLMGDYVVFRLRQVSLDQIKSILGAHSGTSLCQVDLRLEGSIGDEPYPEVDFANCDIGYGVTGTQEEMLFGASPEMCIAMLFCDTLASNQAVSITGPIRVSKFDGYGFNVTVNSFVPIERNSERTIIAIDALDFSDNPDTALTMQLASVSLYRELIKAYAGFSLVKDTKISTGHWGCGAFCGNKQLKALIQLLAATMSNNSLIFYCRNDETYFSAFQDLLSQFNDHAIKVGALWQQLLRLKDKIGHCKDEIFEITKAGLATELDKGKSD